MLNCSVLLSCPSQAAQLEQRSSEEAAKPPNLPGLIARLAQPHFEICDYDPQQHTTTTTSPSHTPSPTAKMAAKNLPPAFNATAQDIEMLLAAQCHLGSKNLQVHMEPYLWKTRPDGINVINIGKTWYAVFYTSRA